MRTKTYKIIKSIGSSKLVSYIDDEVSYEQILLIIPSLINKSYILDLSPNNSLIEFLYNKKIAVFLIEFDDPLAEEYSYGLKENIDKIISKYYLYLFSKFQRKINIMGHCLGSILAIMLCTKYKSIINKMILISPPFDMSYITYRAVIDYFAMQLKLLNVPIIDKSLVHSSIILANYTKFTQFYSNPKLKKNLLLDEWSSDGINLTTKLAKEIILDLYGNSLVTQSEIANMKIDCNNININTLIIAAEDDMLVPILSSRALSDILPHSQFTSIKTGHLGAVIGSNAKEKCWKHIVKFLNNY